MAKLDSGSGKTADGRRLSPLVTIITASFNNAKALEATIASVAALEYENIEYIVIDGGSRDGTVALLEASGDVVDQWLSEPDLGIGDAWNKGLRRAKGEIIGLLNAGDSYESGSLRKVADAFRDERAVYYGICKFVRNGSIVAENRRAFDERRLAFGFGFTHTACFVPRKVYEEVGGFDVDARIAVDTEFLLRCYRKGVKFIRSGNVTYMETGGVSDTSFLKAYFEYLGYLRSYRLIGSYAKSLISIAYFLLNPLRKVKNSSLMRQILRQAKHLLVYALNLIINIIPFFSLRRLVFRMIGVRIGKKSYILPRVRIYGVGNIVLGENSVVNNNCYLDNRDAITIGSNVSIAHDCKFYTGGHDIQSPYFDFIKKPINVGDRACLFAGCMVMPGVSIGEGSVVMAGSVVVKDVPPYNVVGGNPARQIKDRSRQLKYRIDYGFWKAL